MFWTLDLNNIRYIVKPFNGQAQGGMRYLYWAGPGRDFEQRPLALSFISPSQSGAKVSIKEDDTLPDRSGFAPVNRKRSIATDSFASFDSSDSSDSSDSESDSEVGGKLERMTGLAHRVVEAGPGRPLQQLDDSTSDRANHYSNETNTVKQQTFPAKRRKTEVSAREIDQLYRVSPPARRRSDAHVSVKEHLSEIALPTITTSNRPVNDREERRKQGAITRIENHLERKFDQIFTPWAGADQDVSRNALQTILKVITLMKDSTPQRITRTLNKALNGGDGKRQTAGGRKPTRPHFKPLIASLESTRAANVNGGEPNTPSSSSGSIHQELDQKSLQEAGAVSAKYSGPDPRSIPSDSNGHQRDRDLDVDISPSMVLPPRKQNRTTLFIRLATSPEYLPLKLSECLTPLAFYTKVLGAWGVREESVAKMTVTFTWMDPEDKMRTMVMNSQMEGCFAHLVEQVDEAPSWEEKGKCALDVDIVLKD